MIFLYSSQANCPCFHPQKASLTHALFEFFQELLVHPCIFAGQLCWDTSLLSLEEVIFEYQPPCSDPSSLQGFIPWHFTKQIPEVAKVSSPEAQGRQVAPRPPSCTEVLNSTIPWSLQPRLCLSFTFPIILSYAENKVQPNTSRNRLPYALEQEVLSPPALLMTSFVVPPRTRASEHETTPV